jgi:hypothetical protein
MNDPRLNSMHLGPDRRELFRYAREQLLGARGAQTCYFDQGGSGGGSATLHGDEPEGASPELDCCLVDTEQVYPLKIGVNTLGRSSENDLVVADAFISRRHCAILVHSSRGCELHDTASKNGTFLNGTKLGKPTRLKCGDKIRVCERQFVFLVKGQPLPPSSQGQTMAE